MQVLPFLKFSSKMVHLISTKFCLDIAWLRYRIPSHSIPLKFAQDDCNLNVVPGSDQMTDVCSEESENIINMAMTCCYIVLIGAFVMASVVTFLNRRAYHPIFR